MKSEFAKYIKNLNKDTLSLNGSSLINGLIESLKEEIKDHKESLIRGFDESINKGGYAMVYTKDNELLGIAKTELEYQEIINNIASNDYINVFVNSDGYIVDTDIKVEL